MSIFAKKINFQLRVNCNKGIYSTFEVAYNNMHMWNIGYSRCDGSSDILWKGMDLCELGGQQHCIVYDGDFYIPCIY